MTSHRTIHRSFRSLAVLAFTLVLAGAVRADDPVRAAANDPEYTPGYSTTAVRAAPTPTCADRAYASREEFVECQERAAARTAPAGSSAVTVAVTSNHPRMHE